MSAWAGPAGLAAGGLLAVALASGCNYYDFEAHRTSMAGESEASGSGESGDEPGDPFFLPEEWAIIRTLGPLPATAPSDPTNRWADDPAAAELGQRLFFETDYAPLTNDPGFRSCVSCHEPEHWFGGPFAPGADEFRNIPPSVNAAFYTWYNWDGRRDSMWAQSLGPPEDQLEGNRLRVVHVLFEQYRADYDAIFEPPLPPELDPSHPDAARFPPQGKPGWTNSQNGWDSMSAADQILVNRIYANFGKALAAYQRRLVSGQAPFDRYVAGDWDAISDKAKDGLRLFIGEGGCVGCHSTPAFTANGFHNIGVRPSVQDPEGRALAVPMVLADVFNTASMYSDADLGLLDDLEPSPDDAGKFRTKHLRQVFETGRWMHAGQFTSLVEVVQFYVEGGPGAAPLGTLDPEIRPRDIDDDGVTDIVAFLYTLTGEPIPAALTRDTSR